MHRRIAPLSRILAAGVLCLSFAGVATAADTSMVRVLHASPDAPAVDVYLDDAKVDALTDVPFGTISSYLEIPSGDHNVKVYATGTTDSPVIDADISVSAGAMYTVAATDAVANITPQVIQDEPAPDCESASVRVVHLSADAPAVDVAPAGADPADAVVKDLAFPDATEYLSLPAGTYDLEVRPAGTTDVALALPRVAVEACNAYSVFAIGSAATPAVGDQALQAVVAVDATASDGDAAAPEATLPPTDTVGSATADDAGGVGFGSAAALLGVVGLVAFVVAGRRLVTRSAEQDGD